MLILPILPIRGVNVAIKEDSGSYQNGLAQKIKSAARDRSLTTLLIFFSDLPKLLVKGFGSRRMYTVKLPILYSDDALRRAVSGQHPNCFHSL